MMTTRPVMTAAVVTVLLLVLVMILMMMMTPLEMTITLLVLVRRRLAPLLLLPPAAHLDRLVDLPLLFFLRREARLGRRWSSRRRSPRNGSSGGAHRRGHNSSRAPAPGTALINQ